MIATLLPVIGYKRRFAEQVVPVHTSSSSGRSALAAGHATVQRGFQFERESIGVELSIAAALGVFPGGVEAIAERRGAQATQGAAA